MKKISTIFLQAVIILVGIVVLFILIRLPLIEGRAVNLDLLSIYSDPFIIYGYTASIPFFISLVKGFKLLSYVRENSVFSSKSINALRFIKYCAMTLSILIVAAGVYIRIFHSKEDDPAGFIALCIVTTLGSIVIATAAAVSEKILQKALDMKSENDLTI